MTFGGLSSENAAMLWLSYSEAHQLMRSDYNKKLPIGFQCLILKYKRQRSTNIVEHLYHEKQIKQINIPKKKKKTRKRDVEKQNAAGSKKLF